MWTNEQRQYLEEVLGLNTAGWALTHDSAMAPEVAPATLADVVHHDLLVLTYPLDPQEHALFVKIVHSVALGPYTHLQQQHVSLADFPLGHHAARVLAFIDYPIGPHVFGESVWTVLPPVSSMTGVNADVVARKKETWNLLQQFAMEGK